MHALSNKPGSVYLIYSCQFSQATRHFCKRCRENHRAQSMQRLEKSPKYVETNSNIWCDVYVIAVCGLFALQLYRVGKEYTCFKWMRRPHAKYLSFSIGSPIYKPSLNTFLDINSNVRVNINQKVLGHFLPTESKFSVTITQEGLAMLKLR